MRYLSIFTLLVASSSLASATIITTTCSAAPSSTFTNGTGTATYSCNGSGAIAAGSQIIAMSLTGSVDYAFGGNGTNTFQVSWAVPAGFAPSPLVVAITGGASSGGVVSGTSNLGSGLPTTSPFAAFTVVGMASTPQGTVDAGSSRLQVSYTIESIPNAGGVPEPTTLALVGGVLVLAGIRKFRS